MLEIVIICFVAAFISMVGTLPPATINTVAFILGSKQIKGIIPFIAMASLGEFIWVNISLYFGKFIISLPGVDIYIETVASIVLIVIGVSLYMGAGGKINTNQKVNKRPWVQSLWMGIANPLQLPFWTGFIAIAKSYHVDIYTSQYIIPLFALFAIIGSAPILYLYYYLGQKAGLVWEKYMNNITKWVGALMAIAGLARTIYQFI